MTDALPLLAAMDAEKIWTFVIVGLSFALYIGIGWWARARTTSEFYVAGSRVGALAHGMATAGLRCARREAMRGEPQPPSHPRQPSYI